MGYRARNGREPRHTGRCRIADVALNLAYRVDVLLCPAREDTRRSDGRDTVRDRYADRGGLLHIDRYRRRIEGERDTERLKDGFAPGIGLRGEPEAVGEPGHPGLSGRQGLRGLIRPYPAEDQVVFCPRCRDVKEPFPLRLLFLPVFCLEDLEDGRILALVVVCRVWYPDTEPEPILDHDGRPAGPRRLRKVRDDDDGEL
ncbi:hypothetical protein DSECCO2_594750 [anaerobic digester metagenome]